MTNSLTLKTLLKARDIVNSSGIVLQTPLVKSNLLEFEQFKLYFKLENLQTTGCFKIRGIVNVFSKLEDLNTPKSSLVTMSAGNYGLCFGYLCKLRGFNGTVCLPKTAPKERRELMQKLNLTLKVCESAKLRSQVQELEDDGYKFLHPFDDIDLIAGHASLGFEILEDIKEDLNENDIVVISCGGGGLLSGVALALRLSNCPVRIYGVEPVGAPKHYKSRQLGKVQTLDKINTIAAGLAPPFAGKICFDIIEKHVTDIILVDDNEIKDAMRLLFSNGLVVEPSGAAAFAAISSGKISAPSGCKVICILSGGNVSPKEFYDCINSVTKQ